MSENTSKVWRKYLKIDEPVNDSYLRKHHSLNEIFRPVFFFIFNLFAKYYFRIEIYGLENIPEDPYIIAPNHCSVLDQPVISWAIGNKRRKNFYTIATRFFFDNIFARIFMRIAANIVRIDSDKDYMPALQAGCKVLKLRRSLYINPEGTRSEDGKLLPFKTGVGVIAVETNVPIIPAYIDGTFQAMPPFKYFPKPHKIRVYFDKPIYPKEFIDKHRSEQAYDVYKAVTDELFKKVAALKENINK